YYPYDKGEARKSDKHPPKLIFSKKMYAFTPMEIESIPNGFVITWFPGAGKSKLYIVYMETGENLKEVFGEIYDYLEVVFEKGNMNIPHLFCSNVYFKGEDKKERITEVYETDVYNFDKKQAKYVIFKKIKYDSKHKFADRFKLAGLKYYQFTRFRWLK
ncbi:MAG: hypothetical protein LWY06_12370, partial [Firmicutes bacterium]|nr:hypothetical protein [Bacillota bacterium]